jgi:serine/threonine protein phosphatase 1
MKLIQQLPMNQQGRDFVVGDIHGCFRALDQALTHIGFNPSLDRLISVGDLIDRGPESSQVADYLQKPWFYAVLGNHEQALLSQKEGEYESWFLPLDAQLKTVIREQLANIPIIIELNNEQHRFGVIHAQAPNSANSWEQTKAMLNDEEGKYEMIWQRSRCRERQGCTGRVEGIDWIISGHTPVELAKIVGNHLFIDTRFYEGVTGYADQSSLTLVDITHEKLHVIDWQDGKMKPESYRIFPI